MAREPLIWVEIDVDQCQLIYGQAPCMAALGTTGTRKCFNTFRTCQDRSNYDLGSLTYKFYLPQSNIPKEAGVFPCLREVSASEGVVNIAGTDDRLKGLGKRERITFTCQDFSYGDQFTDKYASERRTGVAQSDGVGYDPTSRGTFFGKLRARWPYYAGRACRYNEAFFDNGVLTELVTRHYVLTDMDVDDMSETATFEAKDILALADDDRSTAPVANNGELLADFSDVGTQFTLTPSGIGNSEYETSGRIIIGSELMDFTRSGDVMTITDRGVSNTQVGSHSAGDSVQQTFSVDNRRIDRVIRDLLRDFGSVPNAYIPFSDWQSETDRWAGNLFLTADITKPTGINTLLSEIMQLGVSVWWDRSAQQVGYRVNRPPDEDTVFEFSDRSNIREISVDDRDDERLTQIGIYSDIIDPTLSPTDGDSYRRLRQIVDADAQSDNEFNDVKVRQVYMRWLGSGGRNIIRIIGRRLLNRFRWSPARYKFTVTYDPDLGLADVIRVNSRISQDDTGQNEDTLMQAIAIKYDQPKHVMTVTAETYQFDQRYAFFAPNNTPVYSSATSAQRESYGFFADDTTEELSDGTDAYQFI